MINLKRVVSGIQPSGVLHIGNYLGAVKKWIQLQENKNNQCYYFIADNHFATSKLMENSEEYFTKNNFNELSLKTAACLLACGINPEKSVLFLQSNVPAHYEMAWIINCITPISWLNKMVQFKEKSKGKENNFTSTGVYTYPLLMAADILVYKAQLVPVGEDQIQHLELTRDIAERINKLSIKKDILPLPHYKNDIISNLRIMSLINSSNKMSKSDKSQNACITLTDSDEEINKKIMRAKTDSNENITYDNKQRPEIANLLNIYSQFENKSIDESVKYFSQASIHEFKIKLAESIINNLSPIRDKTKLLLDKEINYLKDILNEGSKQAKSESFKNLEEIKHNLNYLKC